MTIERTGEGRPPTPPFAALPSELTDKGWKETYISEDSKQISIPGDSTAAPTISTEQNLSLPGIGIRIIGTEEISQGSFQVPRDTWNLSFFDADTYNTSGKYAYTFLKQIEDAYLELQEQFPSLNRQSLCFSKDTKSIIVLPSLRDKQ